MMADSRHSGLSSDPICSDDDSDLMSPLLAARHNVPNAMTCNRRWVLSAVGLALTLGLSACVIPRNPFPLREGDGPRIAIALLPVDETNVGGYHGVPTDQLVRVANRVLNTIASSKNNLIGPKEVLAGGNALGVIYMIKTRVVHMPSPTDVSIEHWSMNIEKKARVRVEMKLLQKDSPIVIAESDATEPYEHYTQMLLVVPIGYVGETLGRAMDRATRNALYPLFNAALTNEVSRRSGSRATSLQRSRLVMHCPLE
jgi:hypothetical protein